MRSSHWIGHSKLPSHVEAVRELVMNEHQYVTDLTLGEKHEAITSMYIVDENNGIN